ncbi:MAG TPA: hypothetical protein ENH82_13055 [bacterium]|nr:hypothetical protein [bacterium]
MKRFISTFFAVILLMIVGITVCMAQETTWDSAPISTQLEMDDVLIPFGKGAIFCPSMTDPDNEPVYGVLSEGNMAQDSKTGHRIPLAPGIYTVVLGSGTIDQLIKKRVRVEEGATTLIKPDWSGLVIDVIKESRAEIREYYEIFNLDTGDSYGIGQGVEEGMDEEIITWILPPGRYKIVQSGDNVNAVINFGTIRLMPGELVHANLVVDSKTGDFLGFGYLTDVRQLTRSDKKWRIRSELAGNTLLHYIPSSGTGTKSEASFTATVQWLTDARYESGRHVIPIWSNLEEGLSMDNDKILRKYIDKAELRLTYIYRFTDLLSPYIRVAAETRFFPTYLRFEEPSDYVKVDTLGDTLQIVENAEEIKLGKALSPAYFKQGFGLTSILVKSLPVNFHLRSGYGMRRIFAGGAHIFNSETSTLSPVIETETTGIELLLLGDIRLGRYIIFNTEFDILMPESKKKTWIYDGENRLRLNLTSNVSILFTMEYWKDENVKYIQTRYQTLLRFSKFL